jgi:hypothetical protein
MEGSGYGFVHIITDPDPEALATLLSAIEFI